MIYRPHCASIGTSPGTSSSSSSPPSSSPSLVTSIVTIRYNVEVGHIIGSDRFKMASPRKRKRKQDDGSLDEVSIKKSFKGCDRKSCLLTYCDPLPFCFCHATEKYRRQTTPTFNYNYFFLFLSLSLSRCRCAQDGHTSRWYHLSAGQHYCNECFEYFYRR